MESQMKGRVSYRPMLTEDLDRVMRNERTGYAFPWAESHMDSCLQGKDHCWVIELDSNIVGHGVSSVILDEGHILNICIAHAWQSQGLGGGLLTFMLEDLTRQGAHSVFLEVRESNLAARHLYENHGFKQIGLRKGYYPAGRIREDAIVMQRLPTIETR